MSKPNPNPKPTDDKVIQPKSVQKMLLRYAIGLFALAGLFLGYQYLQNQGRDIDVPENVNTAGIVAAVEFLEDGSQVVAIAEDGTIRRSAGYVAGSTERDPAWRPDGNRLFFISDREEGVFQIFRWNLGSDRVERRSVGSRAKNMPHFGGPEAPDRNLFALTTSGGKVLQFDPKTGATVQVLPPVTDPTATEEGGGGVSQFDSLYDRLGESFRDARWTASKRFVVAVMRREDGNEILVAQDITALRGAAAEGQRPRGPIPLAQGKRIDFDVHPTEDRVVFATRDFQWPEGTEIPEQFRRGATVTRPFQHLVGIADLTKVAEAQFLQLALRTPEGGPAFSNVRISPDGTTVLSVIGEWADTGNLKPLGLIVFPLQADADQVVSPVLRGEVYDPTWAPDSRKLAFVRVDSSGKRSIFTINRDGTSERNLTAGKGNFGSPTFSPQGRPTP